MVCFRPVELSVQATKLMDLNMFITTTVLVKDSSAGLGPPNKGREKPMPNQIRDIATVDHDRFPYILEKKCHDSDEEYFRGGEGQCVPAKGLATSPMPVLVTYGPYGKDIYHGE